MIIKFFAPRPFGIKVRLDGSNDTPGASHAQDSRMDEDTQSSETNIQDTANPQNEGYSIEVHLDEDESAGTSQFEITPAKAPPKPVRVPVSDYLS